MKPLTADPSSQLADTALQAVGDLPESSRSMRRMMLSDLEEVVCIEREIYPFPWTPGNFRDSMRAGYSCWVMTDRAAVGGPRLLGLIGYCVMMQVLDEAHLMNLSVSAAAQGQGHGRRLLQWVLEFAAARSALGMFLEVRPSNVAAIELYRRTGFERIGLRRNYYPNGPAGREDAVVMRCDLRGPDLACQSLVQPPTISDVANATPDEWS